MYRLCLKRSSLYIMYDVLPQNAERQTLKNTILNQLLAFSIAEKPFVE